MQDICFPCFPNKKLQLLKKNFFICVDVVANLHFGKRSDKRKAPFSIVISQTAFVCAKRKRCGGVASKEHLRAKFSPLYYTRTCYTGEEEGTLKIELRETFAFSSSSSFFGFAIGSSSSCCWNERKRQSFPKFSSPFSQKFHYQKNERRPRRDKFRASPPLEEDANSRRPIPTMNSPEYI